MPMTLDRNGWTKKAKALIVDGRTGEYVAVKLMGPSDGTGCLPPGEVMVHQTRFRTSAAKALKEAIAYCDERQIRICEFPDGEGYDLNLD